MDHRDEERAERRSWFDRLHLTWPMLFLLGWVLYELTTQPTVGAVAVCLKFGWEDFRSAIWLRRVDPRRLRGRACFWLYMASGLAKTAGVAGLMSFAFLILTPNLGPALVGQRLLAFLEMAAWTGLAMLSGFVCSMVTLSYALLLARWGGFRLWLSRDIHRARRLSYWPPYEQNGFQRNLLGRLFRVILFVVYVPLLLGLLIVVLFAMAAAIAPGAGDLFSVLVMVGSGLLIAGSVFLLLRLNDRSKLWIASHPGECWDNDPASLPEAEGMVELSANPLK